MAPYSWTIDDSSRTVFVRGYGEGVTADTLDLIAELGPELRARQGYDFIYNSAALRIQSSPADMMRVATVMFQERGLRFRRLALVVPPGRVALAHIFAALAQPFGVVVNVFADEDTARDWLAERRKRGVIEATPTTDPATAQSTEPPPTSPRHPPPTPRRHPPPTFPESPDTDPEQ